MGNSSKEESSQELFDSTLRAKLESRKCPSCQTAARQFTTTGVYLPFEPKAIWHHSQQSESESMQIMPASEGSQSEFFRILFTFDCPTCGLISWWSLAPTEINRILGSDELKKLGFGITWVYNLEELEKALAKEKAPTRKAALRAAIEYCRPYMYGGE